MKGCYNGLQAHYIQNKAISSDDQMAIFSNPNLPFKKRNVSHKHQIIVQNRFSALATDSSPSCECTTVQEKVYKSSTPEISFKKHMGAGLVFSGIFCG